MASPTFAVRGLNVTTFTWRGEAEFRAALAPALAGGVNTLIIDAAFSQASLSASQVNVESGEFSSPAILAAMVQTARSMGFEVWLKPVLFTGTSGNSVDNYQWSAIKPADPAAWFASYGAALKQVLTVVQPYGVSAVLLGNELKQVSTAPEFAGHWATMIAGVRSYFGGKVGYNASAFGTDAGVPDEFSSNVFLGLLDFIGLSTYPQLYSGTNPTVASIEAGWRADASGGDNLLAILRDFIAAHPTLPIAFTELGSPATDGGNLRLAALNHDASAPGAYVRDVAEQALVFDTMLGVLAREFGDQLMGMFPYIWGSNTQFGDKDVEPSRSLYTWELRGKPAADAILAWYSGQRSTHGTTLDGTAFADRLGTGFYNDVLRGGRGNDVLLGGSGNDILHGNGLPADTGSVKLRITASGAILDGEALRAEVQVNGASVGVIDVAEVETFRNAGQAWNGPVTYEFEVRAGTITSLRLAELNWASGANGTNRNLYVNSITLGGVELSASGSMTTPGGQVLGNGQAIFGDGWLALDAAAYNANLPPPPATTTCWTAARAWTRRCSPACAPATPSPAPPPG